jgi:iron complex outermembrane receptor protein
MLNYLISRTFVQRSSVHSTVSAAAVIAACLCSPALAQTAPADAMTGASDLSDITVTARKRAEKAIDIPAAITVIGGDTLAARGAPNLHDLDKLVPSVTITNFGAGNISEATVFIRGIGTADHRITTDPGVGIYVDGVYIARAQGVNFNLTNLDHVEVLRGPQGTLSGRNTLGGAVNLVTKQPSQSEHYEFGAQFGTRGRANFDFYGTTPVTDTLAVSLTGDFEHRNGIGKFVNLPGIDTRPGQILQGGGRFAAKWTPSDDASLLFTMDGMKGAYGVSPMRMEIINPNGSYHLTQAAFPANSNDNGTENPSIPNDSAKALGFSLVGNYRFDDHLSAKIIGSERYSAYKAGLDDDDSAFAISEFPETGHARQYTAEGQINGEWDRFNFVGGVFYFHEKGGSLVANGVSGSYINGTIVGATAVTSLNQTTNSVAGYLHGSFNISDALKLSAGVRYTYDHKEADFFRHIGAGAIVQGSGVKNWHAPTWDVALDYKISPSLAAYATVQRGYQSGGFPPRASSVAAFAPFNPTYATNFEGGLKGRFGSVFNFSTAIFYTQYKDLVLAYNQFIGGTSGFVTVFANAGRSRTYGAEFEGNLNMGSGFSLDGSVGYNNAKVTEVSPGTQGTTVGATPQNSPKWTAALGPQFMTLMAGGNSLTLRADASYRSSYYSQPLNNVYNRIKSRFLASFDISYRLEDKGLSFGVYGNNIFDRKYDVTRVDSFSAGYVEILTNNDRSEFGVKLRKTF